jgi:hypothetical protein
MKLKVMIICAVMFPGIFLCTQAFAEDELYLCGVVQEVNLQTAQVTVDVASDSCRGIRTFKLPTAKDRLSFNVANRKCFFINSNSCKAGYTYTITKTVPE